MIMKTARTRAIIALSLVVAAVCAFLILQRPQPTTSRIRVGYIPFNADLPFFVAMDKGFFMDEDLKIEAVRCGDSTEALNAMLSGHVDMVAGLTFSIFFAAELASPGRFKLFFPFSEEDPRIMSYLLVAKKSGISSLEDLRGKRIGTYTGATQLLYLKLFLKGIGLDPERDVEIIQVSPTLQVQALAANRVDALFTVEPYGTIAIRESAGQVLVENPRSKFILKPFWSGAAAVSVSFWQRSPDCVRRINNALNKAVGYIQSQEEDAKKVLPKFTPMDEQTAVLSGIYRWYRLSESIDFSSIQELSELMNKHGIVPGVVDARGFFFTESEMRF